MASSQGQRPRSTFDQFVKFSTDASGLERTFRLLQAITQILASIEPVRQFALFMLSLLPLSLSLFLPPTSSFPAKKPSPQPSPPAYTVTTVERLLAPATLTALRGQFALGRRFFRVFRFLDAFASAWRLYTCCPARTVGGGELGLETYLEMCARSFNGLYLLLETLHFPEVLLRAANSAAAAATAEGVSSTVWGDEWADMLHVEGQRFWFLALACGAAAGALRLLKMSAFRAVAEEGSGQTLGMVAPEAVGGNGEKGEEEEEEDVVVRRRREEQTRQKEEYRVKSRRILRRLVADLMDLALPGSVVGWVPASTGTVGVLMLGSTWLTGLEVWERCGGE